MQISVEASDDKGVKRVSVFYRTDGTNDFKRVDLVKNEQTGYYHHTVYTPELIAKDYVEYYVAATDGFNETKTETKRVSIERDQKSPARV